MNNLIDPKYSIIQFTARKYTAGDLVYAEGEFLWNGTDSWTNDVEGEFQRSKSIFEPDAIKISKDNFAITSFLIVGNTAGMSGTMTDNEFDCIGYDVFSQYNKEILAIAESLFANNPEDNLVTFLTLWKGNVESYYVAEYGVDEWDMWSELIGVVDLNDVAELLAKVQG